MPSIGEIVTVFVAVFIVVDPLGIVPVFISLTPGFSPAKRNKAILTSIVIAFAVLCLFALTGNIILRLLGIQPGAFFIAGGVLLFIVSIDLLFGRPSRTKISSEGTELERDDIAVFPLAIPMLAGPGTITTILLYVSGEGTGGYTLPMLIVSIALALGAAGVTMRLSSYFLKVLGRTGVSVIERIMGILLSGLSVQFVYDGLLKLGII
jgi:multiple antibiotic resistance protein